MPGPTLEEARQASLKTATRRDRTDRAIKLFAGISLFLALIWVATFVASRSEPLGKAALSAGDNGRMILIPWADAPEVFRQTLADGTVVEARQTITTMGGPPAAELRVGGQTIGTILGEPGHSIELSVAKAALVAPHQLALRLPSGYRAAIPGTAAGPWKIILR